MSRSLRHRFALLAVSLLMAAGSAGCMDHSRPNSDKPGGRLYKMWQASGERVLLMEPDNGDMAYKLRRRSDRYKVYDRTLAPQGYVEWHGADASDGSTRADAGGTEAGSSIVMTVSTLGQKKKAEIERVSDSVYEYPKHFRLEETSRGWVVFGKEAEWSGRFVRRESTWYLESRADDETQWRVTDASGRTVLKHGRESVLKVGVGSLPDPVLLGFGVEKLDLMARVVLGRLLRRLADAPDAT